MHNQRSMLLINDPAVTAVPIVECGEPLVDLRGLGIVGFDDSWLADEGLEGFNPFMVRSSVAERIARAAESLPKGYSLALEDAWRPIWLQERYWTAHLADLRAAHPDVDEAELERTAARLVAPPTGTPPHSTGGAIDVILMLGDARADMGWPGEGAGWGAPTAAKVGEPGERHRSILITAMAGAGFANYAWEWWHWSWGDQYWAHQFGSATAHYGSIDATGPLPG